MITWLCPAELQPLKKDGKEWVSPAGVCYPTVEDIPWLFPDPRHTLAAWRERSSMLLNRLEADIENMKVAVKNAKSVLTRSRLEKTRHLQIRHIEMLRRVLDPIKPNTHLSLAQQQAYGYRLPLRQNLLSYFPNLVRDWSADFAVENQLLFDATMKMLDSSLVTRAEQGARVLVLGAGGSRLAYDWAKRFPKSEIIAYDLNPILLLGAKAINDGATLAAAEQSVSPKTTETPGRDVELKAPAGKAANLHFAFGDVYALPLEEKSIDICVTPWLIDILPRRFDYLCSSIARVVKSNGAWVNAGSWHFDFADQIDNLSVGEAAEIAAALGWKSISQSLIETPYLQSTFDAHRRFETMTCFLWTRTEQTVATRPLIDDRSEWTMNPDIPIPPHSMFVNGALTHAAMALILSLVDGKNTVRTIGETLAAEHGMTVEQGMDAAASFFDRFTKDGTFREKA